ncbi:MAG TPA: hypothetical protein VG184_09645 [Acidimicrobiales bacterium]|nr:hypothetical protein [Acidimicrobiales bacterium]
MTKRLVGASPPINRAVATHTTETVPISSWLEPSTPQPATTDGVVPITTAVISMWRRRESAKATAVAKKPAPMTVSTDRPR